MATIPRDENYLPIYAGDHRRMALACLNEYIDPDSSEWDETGIHLPVYEGGNDDPTPMLAAITHALLHIGDQLAIHAQQGKPAGGGE